MSKRTFLAGLAFATTIALGSFGLTTGPALSEEAGHNKDYRTFVAGGDVKYGQIGDSYTAELVMYLAGNQFMVMEELIKEFQSLNPDIKSIYVETIPPGQILKGQI